MSASILLQGFIVGLVVLACAMRALRQFAPTLSLRVQVWLAARLDRPRAARWRRSLGRRLRPLPTGGGACGSGGDACSRCGGCAAARPDVRRAH